MGVSNRKDKTLSAPEVITEFWEAWVLALVLVTILGFFGKSQQTPLVSQTEVNRAQFDPLEVTTASPEKQGRPLESGF